MKGFRVYDKDACQYVTDEMYWVVDSDGNLKSVEDGDLIRYPSCIRESDTGLKDKHGTKIFEGDILKGDKRVGVVCWGKYNYSDCDEYYCEHYGWYVKCDMSDRYLGDEDGYDLSQIENYKVEITVEVIGNIHDKPELLEEQGNENN